MHRDPRFRPEHLRVVEIEGKIIGMMLFIERTVRIGIAKVRCAIVAPVATDATTKDVVFVRSSCATRCDWAIKDGFHLSMLWGHAWLYPRYGYAPGLKQYAMVLAPISRQLATTVIPSVRRRQPTPHPLACYHPPRRRPHSPKFGPMNHGNGVRPLTNKRSKSSLTRSCGARLLSRVHATPPD